MKSRVKAALTVTKPKLKDLLLNPGVFITAALSTALGFGLVKSFTSIVSSGRLLFEQNGIYFLIRRIIEPLFGETVFTKLFSEGPFLFALIVSIIPFLLYVIFFSTYSLGFEKNSGVITLVSFGPSDYASYSLANIIRDLIFTAAFMIYLFIFFFLLKNYFGLILGTRFFIVYFLLFFFSLTLFTLIPFVVMITRSPGSGVLLLLLLIAALFIVDISSFIIAGTYIETLTELVSSIFKWISPFFYLRFGLTAGDGPGLPAPAGSAAALAGFTAAIFFLTRLIDQNKGGTR